MVHRLEKKLVGDIGFEERSFGTPILGNVRENALVDPRSGSGGFTL